MATLEAGHDRRCCWPTSTCRASTPASSSARCGGGSRTWSWSSSPATARSKGRSRRRRSAAFDYLTKPIVDEEIRVVVEKAARQQSLLFENHALRQQLDLRFGLENVVGHDHRC